MPRNITSPVSIFPVTLPSDSTCAAVTRCIIIRIKIINRILTRAGNAYGIVTMGVLMARGKAAQDTSMLSMALIGYEMEKQKIEAQIQAIRARLGTRGTAGKTVGESEEHTSELQSLTNLV